MYEMLSLSQPFRAKSVADTINKILKIDPPVLKTGSKKLSKDMEAILFKCLEKTSESRYDQAELLKEDINNFLGSKPIMARPVGKIKRSFKLIERNKLASLLVCAALTILLIMGLYASTYYLISKGKNYVDAERGPEAIRSYEWALRFLTVPLFPKKAKSIALSGMGDAWSAVGDYGKAIDYYRLALQIDPNNVPALSGMGDTYTEMRAYEKTIEFYNKVIVLSPGGRNGSNGEWLTRSLVQTAKLSETFIRQSN